ncbi:hypothetical protein GJU84_04500 [Staphylococcus chromogenes]|uniref:hypothetical protein n=1 Tax=Staphylococcus chromogenes TaxID=46126 RepID=UPI001404C0A5|nr:hypothetical protein [Staphylococcus chromogenes]QIN26331.1 hypothetical protein GJU84_04500 [Staphylococcus chromogenes]
MILILLLSLLLAVSIVIGVFRSTKKIFNLSAILMTIFIFVVDFWLHGWHKESFKIMLICIVIIVFEVYHIKVKMGQMGTKR